MPFFSSEQKKTEEGDAAEASIAGALNGKLRSSMIKLCFAGLLAAASVFQILSLVQAVADGTQRVAKISQGLDVLSDVEAQSDGLEALILNAAPAMRWPIWQNVKMPSQTTCACFSAAGRPIWRPSITPHYVRNPRC